MKNGQIIELEGKEYKYIGMRGRNCHVFISNEGTEIAFTNGQLVNYIENEEIKLKKRNMKTKKPLTKVNCGDWHETWGMGTNKIGKLSIEIVPDCPINFVWKGHSQGRHGQVWNRGANARFMLVNGELQITSQKGHIPRLEIIREAVNILLRENKLPEL